MTDSDHSHPAFAALRRGGVIPAHPLALTAQRRLDETRQRALSRYYLDAGVIGLAVAVHTTQFAIREHGLLGPVLDLAADEARHHQSQPLLVAGVLGPTSQATAEAELARSKGYHAVLLGLAAMKDATEDQLVDHCRAVARVMPVIGFYLQTAVGGQHLSYDFWCRFAEIENVVAIKIAPFNRYRTLDVLRAVVDVGAEKRISLYTGNDDHIVADLMARFTFLRGGEPVSLRIRGGLLGHWAVWTRRAVELLEQVHQAPDSRDAAGWLELDARVTESNAALFDVENDFSGCIAGIHEILRRQGLLEGTWCLDPQERMGPGQAARLDRIIRDYPDLTDDDFVRQNLSRWLAQRE